ncbi:MAG: diguanylate cyclase [Lachnospiraceae bacterium]|nr:diguanylate cyclase [Lachnospiraceae bacterium]
MKNTIVHFEAVPYPTLDDAIEALKNGEIDCVFPLNLSTYDAESKGLMMINPIMRTEMSVLTRENGNTEISPEKKLTVAIDEGNISYETLINDEIPAWEVKFCPSVEDCFKAVDSNEADGVLASNYRMNEYEALRMKYRFNARPIGQIMGVSFAIKEKDNPELYSILNKIANLSNSEDMEFALASYIYENKKISLLDFLEDNWIGVLLFIIAVFVTIMFLLGRKLRAERRFNEQQKQIEESLRRELKQKEQLESVTRKAYTDPLTGVKSKHSFEQWKEEIDNKIIHGVQEPFAVVVFDVNDLKKVNDTYGHQEGDECIKRAAARICSIFDHSPVFRIGGDEFVSILSGEDYELRALLMNRMNMLPKDRSKIRFGDIISAGMMEYRKEQHHSFQSVFEAADSAMYERKQYLKSSAVDEDRQEEIAEVIYETYEKYEFSSEERTVYERLKVPFAVYQFVDGQVVTLILSDGFCEMLGYRDRNKAYFEMDHHMYKDTHPDDVERISNEAFRFATEGGEYNVIYRTRIPGTSRYRNIRAIGEHVMTDTGFQLAQIWYTDEGEEEPL